MKSIISYLKNDLISTKIGLGIMWSDKKYFLFAVFITAYIAFMIGATIFLMVTVIPLLRPWIALVANKSDLLKAILWMSRYLLLGPGIILTIVGLEFMPVAIAYYTFQHFKGQRRGLVQAFAHMFYKIKKHGPFAPFHQHAPFYFFAPLMAMEDLNWNVPAAKMPELWNKTIFSKNMFFWWSRAFVTLLIGIIMFKILTTGVAQANRLRNIGIDLVSMVFIVISTLELFLLLILWVSRIIFKTALYAYSQKQPTGAFPQSFVQDFFIHE